MEKVKKALNLGYENVYSMPYTQPALGPTEWQGAPHAGTAFIVWTATEFFCDRWQ
jgi:hypothetical protein